jgi:A/G-specific adenine glycosylase
MQKKPRKCRQPFASRSFLAPSFTLASHPSLSSPEVRAAFQTALLNWYREHRRELPWRSSPSVYKTVVSEFMLQQTQVKTVLPYFHRWLQELPNFRALAGASEEKVLKLWEGLGYYSRARNLHRLAKALVALPEIPKSPEAWKELPGVGPYTAAAITSISFSAPVACVDGNVVRILSRIIADPTEFRDSASAAKAFTKLANCLVPPENPVDHNQAMMELGATICHRQNPLCTVCPVLAFCAAGKAGDVSRFPRLAAKKIEQLSVARIWCRRNGALLLHRVDDKAKRLAQLHELPSADHLGVPQKLLQKLKPVAVRKRSITRYAITETIYALSELPSLPAAGFVWVPVEDLASITLSGPHRRWISELIEKSTEERKG